MPTVFFFFLLASILFSPLERPICSYFQGTSSAYLLGILLIYFFDCLDSLSEAKILYSAASPMIRMHITEDSKAKLTLFALNFLVAPETYL